MFPPIQLIYLTSESFIIQFWIDILFDVLIFHMFDRNSYLIISRRFHIFPKVYLFCTMPFIDGT